MKKMKVEEMGIHELTVIETKNINGGFGPSWSRIGGWLAVALGEIVDVVTSGGDNLKEAWQNGYNAGRN